MMHLLFDSTCLEFTQELIKDKNASSTFVGVNADVSKKGRPADFAYASPSSVETWRADDGRSTLLPHKTIGIWNISPSHHISAGGFDQHPRMIACL